MERPDRDQVRTPPRAPLRAQVGEPDRGEHDHRGIGERAEESGRADAIDREQRCEREAREHHGADPLLAARRCEGRERRSPAAGAREHEAHSAVATRHARIATSRCAWKSSPVVVVNAGSFSPTSATVASTTTTPPPSRSGASPPTGAVMLTRPAARTRHDVKASANVAAIAIVIAARSSAACEAWSTRPSQGTDHNQAVINKTT